MKARPVAADAERHRRAGDRIPTDSVLELTFDVRPEKCTWLTVEGSRGEAARRRIHGTELPFEDGSFDRLVCSEGFQLLANRGRALEEMHRVLVRGGEIEVVVPGSIEGNPPFAELAASLERRSGARGAAAIRWLFCMPQPDDLRGALAAAGFENIRVEVVRETDRSGSIAELLSRAGFDPKIVPEMASLERELIRTRGGFLTFTETISGRARRV